VGLIILALLWTAGAIPHVPIASEVIGLLAALLAPGIAVEPAVHGERWTLVERIGLAATLSLALAGLFGVGLHVAGMTVSPTNILVLLLLVSLAAGVGSIRFRKGYRAVRLPRAMRLEIAVGLGSLVLLAGCFISILLLHPAPEGPVLEVMAVDDTGRLLSMPLRSDVGGSLLTIEIRSASGGAKVASIVVDGAGISSWSASNLAIGPEWALVKVQVRTTRTGTVLAHITVSGGGTELMLPIEMEVAH
jgi:hypothetical protein